MLILQIRSNINNKKYITLKKTNNYVHSVFTDKMFRKSIYMKIDLLKSQSSYKYTVNAKFVFTGSYTAILL
jgi:hypothetical protein